jgi:hypothetical protein
LPQPLISFPQKQHFLVIRLPPFLLIPYITIP